MSTRDQNAAAQVDALTAAGCDRVFVDRASGKVDRRPDWDRLLEQLRAGDQLVVTKLDRIGRSMRHLIEVATDLEHATSTSSCWTRASTRPAQVAGCCSTCWPRWPSSSAT